MDKSFDKLRRTVLHAVDEQRSAPKVTPRGSQYVFAQYVRVQLTKLSMSEATFAQSVHLPLEQVHTMLDGLLPDQALTDDLIARIAHSVRCEANLLRIMLKRPYTPAADTTSVDDVSGSV